MLSLRCSACGHSWAFACENAPTVPDVQPEPPVPSAAARPFNAHEDTPAPFVAPLAANSETISNQPAGVAEPVDQKTGHKVETEALPIPFNVPTTRFPRDMPDKTASRRPTTPDTSHNNTLNAALGVVLILLLLLAAIILARHGIMKWLPGSAKAFAKFGLS